MQPKVSIIVLTYNQKSTILRALASIISQTTEYDYEIIIGDDASIDGTREICEEFKRRHSSIVNLIEKHANYGVVKNFYTCLQRSTGKYLMVCAGDDWWHNQNKIQKQVEYMEAYPNVVLLYTGYDIYYAKSKTIRKNNVHILSEPAFESLITFNRICAPSICARMSSIREVNYSAFIANDFAVEDYPTWLSLSKMGDFAMLGDSYVTYTVSDGSLDHQKEYEGRIAYLGEIQKIRHYFINKEKNLEDKVNDAYYMQMMEAAINFKKRKDALLYSASIRRKNMRIIVKRFLCTNWIFFNALRMITSRHNKNNGRCRIVSCCSDV